MAGESEKTFSNNYAALVRGATAISEPEAQAYKGVVKKISEEVVRCLWFGGHFDRSKLYTEGGARLEIISPGRWNVEGGPDHLNAEILLEGAGRLKGDVEVHVCASDWRRHGHDRQQTYKDVCLHVVMWNDSSKDYVRDVTGRNIPQLALSRYVTIPPEEVPGLMDDLAGCPDAAGHVAGPCKSALMADRADGERTGYILDQAGDERILSRAGRFEEHLSGRSLEQVLYEALMRAMGYKNNVLQFSQLAVLMPLEDLRRFVPMDAAAPGDGEDEDVEDRAVWIQSMLLGAGGILSGWRNRHRDNYDGQTGEYIRTLFRRWEEVGPKWGGEPMNYDDWHWAGVRPLNQPPRRIAAMSRLLAAGLEGGVFRNILAIFEEARGKKAGRASTAVRKVEDYFSDAGMDDGFWPHHLTPGGKRLKTPARLIGGERAAVIFINVILPLFLAYARKTRDAGLEALLHEAYAVHRKNSTDSVTRFMIGRVLPEEWSGTVNSARRQQGLHQIFRDFCQRKDISCDRCGFLAAIGETATPDGQT